MSQQLFADDVLFLQRFLKTSGFNPGKLDGVYGKKTDQAFNAFHARTEEIAQAMGVFDPRTEQNIRSLQPRAQETARAFMRRVLDAGFNVRIISGTRTYAEQDALFRKGRFGNPGPRVTNARGGKSNHNFGIAWDIGIFKDGKYLGESPLYKKVPEAGLVAGLEWGGHWQTFPDQPHYQLATGLQISAVQVEFEGGQSFV